MRAFEFVDVCSPANLDVLQGGAFDDDDDILLDATECHIKFRKVLTEYAGIEVDFTSTQEDTQIFALYLVRNVQLPLDGQPTSVQNVILNTGDIKTLKLPYCGEIEGFLFAPGLNARIKAIRIVQIPQNFSLVVNEDAVIPNFPIADGWTNDDAAGIYTLSLAPGSNHAASIATLLDDLDEDGWLVVTVEASNNFGSTQTSMAHETLYTSEPVQKFYLDADEGNAHNFTFHARSFGGCTITVTVFLGQFKDAISAFGSSSVVVVE